MLWGSTILLEIKANSMRSLEWFESSQSGRSSWRPSKSGGILVCRIHWVVGEHYGIKRVSSLSQPFNRLKQSRFQLDDEAGKLRHWKQSYLSSKPRNPNFWIQTLKFKLWNNSARMTLMLLFHSCRSVYRYISGDIITDVVAHLACAMRSHSRQWL